MSRIEAGSGFAAVHGTLAVLVGDDSEELREAVWNAVRFEGFDSVLDALTLDGALRPECFVVAHEEPDGLRLLLRGDAVVAVTTNEGSERCDALGVRTWSERFLADWTGFVATVERPEDPSALCSVVESGMVAAASCTRTRLDLTSQCLAGGEPAKVDGISPPPRANDDIARVAGGEPSPTAEPDGDAPVAPDESSTDEPSPHDERAGDGVMEIAADSSYFDMFGATRHRSVTDAAIEDPEVLPVAIIEVPNAARPDTEPAPHSDRAESTWSSRNFDSSVPVVDHSTHDGDHDGHTLSIAEVRRLRGADIGAATTTGIGTATVQALICAIGHLNPPYDAVCRICQEALDGPPSIVDRPPLGRLRFSTGDNVILDRSLLVGRKPDPKGRRFSDIPRLLPLDVGDGLSRSHALVSLDGWQVRVEDLGSTNDTTVTLPGRQPQRLRSGEPVLIVDGTTIDLGGEVECVFDAEL